MKLLRTILPIAALLWMAPGPTATAHELPDSIPAGQLLSRTAKAATEVARFEKETFTPNPASMFYFLPYTLSDFRARGSYAGADEAENMQTGTGHLMGSVEASSYMRLNRNMVVWGDAGFTTGQKRRLIWNNAADLALVGPYVLGDSVGGNLSNRSYRFSGGYAGAARRWSWGAEAAYTASIDYRNRDPRDKIVVSDLLLRIGGSRVVAGRYVAGAAGSLRIYNQESDLEFYNPNNDIRTYLLTGLGNYYARFSGISSHNTAYKGIGAGGAVQLLPSSGYGFSFMAEAAYMRMTQVLRDYNNLELTCTQSYALSVRSGYTVKRSALTAGVLLSGHLMRRGGFENIFGSSTGSNYEQLGSVRNYLLDMAEGTLELPVEFPLSAKLNLEVSPGFSANYSCEDYRLPHRVLEYHGYTPGLRAQLQWRQTARLLWQLSGQAERRFAGADRRNLAGLGQLTGIARMVEHNFAMATACRTVAQAGVGGTYQLDGSMALKVTACGVLASYHGHGKANEAQVCVGLVF